MNGVIANTVRRTVNVREREVAAVVWSAAYFFFILSAYYVIRPIRDEMGVAAGVENLVFLFTGTMIGVLLLHPVYTALVSRFPRRQFVPFTYRFFILNLALFFFLFHAADVAQSVWVARAFYVWTSVFNLFIVSVFWSFMTDIYRPWQSKRLFGVVAVGGTLGALLGASITSALVGLLGPVNLLLVSALLLEIAGRASSILGRHEENLAREARREAEEDPAVRAAAENDAKADHSAEVIGGGVMDGIRHVAGSPYLLGIAGLMLLFPIVSTFLYFHLMNIVATVFEDDPVGRTRLFANMDMAVQVLTLVTQVFLTGRILRWFGLGIALAFLPVVSIIGFGILATAPILAVVVLFQVFRRAGNFAIQRPAREVLYTPLARTDKYKAKNFNDTFVYRAGDQVAAWSYTGMAWLGLGLSGLALTMVPVSAVWLALALWMGWKHREVERRGVAVTPAPAVGAAGD